MTSQKVMFGFFPVQNCSECLQKTGSLMGTKNDVTMLVSHLHASNTIKAFVIGGLQSDFLEIGFRSTRNLSEHKRTSFFQ